MSSENPYASPMSVDPPVATSPRSGRVWRRLDHIVVSRRAIFPDRCVKCNRPAQGKVVRCTVSWHPWWIHLLLVTCILYLIVAVVVGKTMAVRPGVCLRHRIQRWLLVILGIVAVVFAYILPGVLATILRTNAGIGIAVTIGGFVVCIYFALRAFQFLRATWIDGDIAWIKGTCAEFRASLPEWPGG